MSDRTIAIHGGTQDTELDARVAVEVMGWHDGSDVGCKLDEVRNGVRDHCWHDERGLHRDSLFTFRPSSDMRDAWQVVEEMERRGHHVKVMTSETEKNFWEAMFMIGSVEYVAGDERVAVAICLAALHAITEEATNEL